MAKISPILTSGDLEVMALYESHGALANIINPSLYAITGNEPHQQVVFHSKEMFSLFLVRIVEIFAPGNECLVEGIPNRKLSLFEAMEWLSLNHVDECEKAGLTAACGHLREWLEDKPDFVFWCPDISSEIRFPLKNQNLIQMTANIEKHTILRLDTILRQLTKKCFENKVNVTPQEAFATLRCFMDEAEKRILYHSSYLVELLGYCFIGINNIIKSRYIGNQTNICTFTIHPEDVSSDVYRNLYTEVLVFKNYDYGRILGCIPMTSEYLRLRYR